MSFATLCLTWFNVRMDSPCDQHIPSWQECSSSHPHAHPSQLAHILEGTQSIQLTALIFPSGDHVTTKHNLLVRLTVLSFAGLLLIANAKAYAQDAAAQTKAEIDRLQQSLKAQPVQ